MFLAGHMPHLPRTPPRPLAPRAARRNPWRPREDLAGQQFGELTAVSKAPHGPSGRTRWLCRCSCGAYTVAQTNHLRSGDVTKCVRGPTPLDGHGPAPREWVWWQ